MGLHHNVGEMRAEAGRLPPRTRPALTVQKVSAQHRLSRPVSGSMREASERPAKWWPLPLLDPLPNMCVTLNVSGICLPQRRPQGVWGRAACSGLYPSDAKRNPTVLRFQLGALTRGSEAPAICEGKGTTAALKSMASGSPDMLATTPPTVAGQCQELGPPVAMGLPIEHQQPTYIDPGMASQSRSQRPIIQLL